MLDSDIFNFLHPHITWHVGTAPLMYADLKQKPYS